MVGECLAAHQAVYFYEVVTATAQIAATYVSDDGIVKSLLVADAAAAVEGRK